MNFNTFAIEECFDLFVYNIYEIRKLVSRYQCLSLFANTL
jgi:hypothetical protein